MAMGRPFLFAKPMFAIENKHLPDLVSGKRLGKWETMRQTISQSSNHHPQQGCLLRNGLHSHLCLVKPPSTIPQINIYPSKKRGLSELMLVWGMVFFQSPVVCLKTANQLFTGLPKYVL